MSSEENVFDAGLSQQLKDEGMAVAAKKRKNLLTTARQIARYLAKVNGTVTADDVQRVLVKHNLGKLGPAAGSLFKTGEFEPTGERIRSEQVKNHAREQYVWRLKQ